MKSSVWNILLMSTEQMKNDSMNAAKGLKLGTYAFGAAFAAPINRKMRFI